MAYDTRQVENYIRQQAKARGIDPETAVRVARSEGLGDGVWQSNFKKDGVREPSYGPFQLLVGGEGTNYPAGMGNDFIQATGKDPSDPANVFATVDFALDRAAKGGWSPWYGAAKVGVGNFDGLKGAASPPQAPGTPAPPLPPPRTISDSPVMAMAPKPAPQVPQGPQPPSERMMQILGSMAVAQPQQPQFSPVQMQGPSPQQAQALTSFIQALKSRGLGIQA